jgi:hypothetical protein
MEDHRDIAVAIRELDSDVANDLVRLRNARNIADYDTARLIPPWQARLALDIANRLLAYS